MWKLELLPTQDCEAGYGPALKPKIKGLCVNFKPNSEIHTEVLLIKAGDHDISLSG